MDDTDASALTVELTQSTDVHDGIDFKYGPTHKWSPSDLNVGESDALVAEVTSIAEGFGARLDTSKRRVKDHGFHYDHGVSSTLYESIAYLFASGGAGWLFLRQVQPLILQWLKNKGSRGIKVARAGFSMEIKGKNDYEELLRVLREHDQPVQGTMGRTKATKAPRKAQLEKENEGSSRQKRLTAASTRTRRKPRAG